MKHLQQLFKNKTAAKTNKILLEALTQVATALTLSDDLLIYLKGSLPIIAATIQNAMSTETLHKVFLEPSYPESAPQIARLRTRQLAHWCGARCGCDAGVSILRLCNMPQS